eukprot:COSAG02_NODE_49701_length_325_cov_0.690265_1_plen_22_part_01
MFESSFMCVRSLTLSTGILFGV